MFVVASDYREVVAPGRGGEVAVIGWHWPTAPSKMSFWSAQRWAVAALKLRIHPSNASTLRRSHCQKHGLDFCCQGGLTVREACAHKQIDASAVVTELEAAMAAPAESGCNPAQLSVPELADHIIKQHHDHVRRELPRLHAMAERVAHVHGRHTPSLVAVLATFRHLAAELAHHIEKEEMMLFPAILRMHEDRTALDLEAPIRCMMLEHDDAGEALAKLRGVTNGFNPPPEACITYRALFAGLAEFEADLHQHIHLENSVLFPAARALSPD